MNPTDKSTAFPSPIVLQKPSGARATVSPYGAHVLSWRPAGDEERLFLSERAEYRFGTPIRGGVPVIFPQFAGEGTLPKKHGFARTALWKMVEQTPTRAQLHLTDAQASHELWPFRYLAEITVTLDDTSLRVELAVSNHDERAFAFTAALHTYIRVANADNAVVHGLRGLRYRDTAHNGVEADERPEALRIEDEIDRIYFNVPTEPAIALREPSRRTRISGEGFCDVVVWNPGADKAAQFADLDPEGWRRFVCVESAVIGKTVKLAPKQRWSGAQILHSD